MKDQIIISKHNAELAVAVPLYRWHHEDELAKIKGYSIALTNGKPLAYAVDMGDKVWLFNADTVECQCEFLGEL